MRKIVLVVKHEILSTLGKPSFWLTTFVLPAFIMAISFGSQFISAQIFEEEAEIPAETDSPQTLAIGYVDQADLIQALPEDIPAQLVQAFSSETEAQAALEAGDLRQYYLIPPDYLETGDLLVVERDFAPMGNLPTMELFKYVMTYNLVGDAKLAKLAAAPLENIGVTALEKTTTSGEDYGTRFLIGYGVLFIFFFVLSMSSSFMLRSVSQEKESRIVEVLLVSLRPRELMFGKVLGLGAVALLQMGIWMGGSMLVLTRGDSFLSSLGMMLDQVVFPQGFFAWALAYFILGYLLYASLLGAIGALAPNARETGQFTFLAMLPLMLPLWLNTAFVEAPNGALATVISLFPLTAPTSMLPRLVAGGVPAWQPWGGVVLLAAATYFFILLSARFFRADTLLSTAALNWERLVKEFKQGA